MKHLIYPILVMLLLTACTQTPSPLLQNISYGNYAQVSYAALPQWESDDHAKAFEIFKHSCKQLRHKTLFANTCHEALVSSLAPKVFFETYFTPFKALQQEGLATGYFEPSLKGSRVKSEQYPYPIYGVPHDMMHIELPKAYALNKPLRGRIEGNKIVPYFSRETINTTDINATPLCYVDDRIERFFLQVQGSGQVALDDNTTLYLGYGDQNGHPYYSIGKEMINKGYLSKDEVSLQSIRAYLEAHPEHVDEILHANPSFVFFKEREGGVSGSLGYPLVPERSIAVDRENIPLGTPVFISTSEPLTHEPFEHLMFAHDTGGAIKGEVRIDIFFGAGEMAREKAGLMQAPLRLWVLIPNDFLSKQSLQ